VLWLADSFSNLIFATDNFRLNDGSSLFFDGVTNRISTRTTGGIFELAPAGTNLFKVFRSVRNINAAKDTALLCPAPGNQLNMPLGSPAEGALIEFLPLGSTPIAASPTPSPSECFNEFLVFFWVFFFCWFSLRFLVLNR
jgi:hypothetical protein